jgi:hypothetical protein
MLAQFPYRIVDFRTLGAQDGGILHPPGETGHPLFAGIRMDFRSIFSLDVAATAGALYRAGKKPAIGRTPLLSLLSRGGVVRSAVAVRVKQLIFLNEPPRRFAAPRLDQGGELVSFRLTANPSQLTITTQGPALEIPRQWMMSAGPWSFEL